MIAGLAKLMAGLGEETFETWLTLAGTPPGGVTARPYRAFAAATARRVITPIRWAR